jgi:hypothetical protein
MNNKNSYFDHLLIQMKHVSYFDHLLIQMKHVSYFDHLLIQKNHVSYFDHLLIQKNLRKYAFIWFSCFKEYNEIVKKNDTRHH